MAIVKANDDTLQAEIESGDLVLVDFWAPWCAPCKIIDPVLEEISTELGDKLKIIKVNVDESPGSAERFSIMSIPTLMMIKNDQVVDKFIGVQPKESLMNEINKHI